MAQWMNRIKAAVGVGADKAESDVAYDPALDESGGGDITNAPTPDPVKRQPSDGAPTDADREPGH